MIEVNKGDAYGRLTIIREVDRGGKRGRRFLCSCECGNIKDYDLSAIRGGNTKSCGCAGRERLIKFNKETKTTHGHTKWGDDGRKTTRTYRTWRSMKQRCYDKTSPGYKRYGGKGITVCKKWMLFDKFLEDMGERPEGTSLDRINNNKGYCKKNCRWSTREEQGSNTSSNHVIVYKGKMQSIAEWARELGVNKITLQSRITKYRWPIEKALTHPVRKRSRANSEY